MSRLATVMQTILVLVCFILAAFGVAPGKPSLVPLGLAAWVLTNLI